MNNKIRYDNNDIFVSVPAYNEHFLFETVKLAYERAEKPERIYFGIFNQKSNSDNFEDFSDYENVRCVNVRYEKPLGASLARLNASTLHENEKYFMQIDAHTIFAPNWDSFLQKDLDFLLCHVEKPIISQTVRSFSYEDFFNSDSKTIEKFTGTDAYPFGVLVDEDGNLYIGEDNSRENDKKYYDKFLEHYFCMGSAGLFSLSSFIEEVSYNPWITLAPEQEFTGLRACTRGYRMFSTPRNYVATMVKDEKYLNTYKDDLCTEENTVKTKVKYDIVNRFLLGNEFGFYGAPDKDSYDQYIEKSKVDFNITKTIGQKQRKENKS
jgi:hypothetical protein